jgi:glycerophosphoryl diester phosphodiesterase
MAGMAVQAHRGSPDPVDGIGENTIDAFVRSRRLGADGVELDVRLTSDGAVAVHHDPVIPGVGPVSELRAAELPVSVPLLGAALEACEGMIVNIEIKNQPGEPGFDPGDRLAGEVADLVVSSGRASSVVVSSFWPDALAAVARARPGIRTGLLSGSWADPAGGVEAALGLGCSALHPHIGTLDAALVDAAHAAGLSVATWTVNLRDQLVGARDAGADTVITDDVALAVAVLGTGRARG